MLGSQFHFQTFSGQINNPTDRLIFPPKHPSLGSSSCSSFQFLVHVDYKAVRCDFRYPKSIGISSKASPGSSGSTNAHNDHGHDYLQASILASDTIQHYLTRKLGFRDEMRWRSSGKIVFPFGVQATKEYRPVAGILGQGFLHRFQNPTIFLKVSCDGDFVLPIIVGEFAIEKLIDAIQGGDDVVCPDQFHLMGNVAEELGYEVKMVKITERVANTYFARLCFSKPGENEILSVDARPSDAINVASRCKAAIYIHKQIVISDAIQIGYGTGRMPNMKPTYDVSLDSAAEGPDSLVEELDLVRNMNLAVQEESLVERQADGSSQIQTQTLADFQGPQHLVEAGLFEFGSCIASDEFGE